MVLFWLTILGLIVRKFLPSTLHLIIIYTWHLIDYTQFSHLCHIVDIYEEPLQKLIRVSIFHVKFESMFLFFLQCIILLMSSNGASNEIEQIWYVFVPCYIGHGKQLSFCAACFLSPKQSFFFLDKKGRQCGSKWKKVHQKVQSKWCTHPPIKSQALVRINNIIFSFSLFFFYLFLFPPPQWYTKFSP